MTKRTRVVIVVLWCRGVMVSWVVCGLWCVVMGAWRWRAVRTACVCSHRCFRIGAGCSGWPAIELSIRRGCVDGGGGLHVVASRHDEVLYGIWLTGGDGASHSGDAFLDGDMRGRARSSWCTGHTHIVFPCSHRVQHLASVVRAETSSSQSAARRTAYVWLTVHRRWPARGTHADAMFRCRLRSRRHRTRTARVTPSHTP